MTGPDGVVRASAGVEARARRHLGSQICQNLAPASGTALDTGTAASMWKHTRPGVRDRAGLIRYVLTQADESED